MEDNVKANHSYIQYVTLKRSNNLGSPATVPNSMIDFIKNYADVHHHGKEEKFLFKEMVDNLSKIGQNLIRIGMLVEHDLGRKLPK